MFELVSIQIGEQSRVEAIEVVKVAEMVAGVARIDSLSGAKYIWWTGRFQQRKTSTANKGNTGVTYLGRDRSCHDRSEIAYQSPAAEDKGRTRPSDSSPI
jgi:hypothetical protein